MRTYCAARTSTRTRSQNTNVAELASDGRLSLSDIAAHTSRSSPPHALASARGARAQPSENARRTHNNNMAAGIEANSRRRTELCELKCSINWPVRAVVGGGRAAAVNVNGGRLRAGGRVGGDSFRVVALGAVAGAVSDTFDRSSEQ